MAARVYRRRSLREWAVRGGIAFAIVVLGYGGITHTLAANVRSFDAKRAEALAPRDGRNGAAYALAIATSDVDGAERDRADHMALVALRHDPTAVEAVSALGLNAQVRGNTTVARRYFAYGMRLSRRELQAQLWAIEDAVARGDVPAALLQYDIALRTSRIAPDLLHPVLAGAIADPLIRTALVRRLAHRPPWGSAFLDFVGENAPDVVATAQLFLQLGHNGLPVPQMAQASVVSRLISTGEAAKAWAYYVSVHSGADRRRSRDPAFTARYDYPTLFDWRSVDTIGLTASIQVEATGGAIDFAAPAGVGGIAAQQLQFLPPGSYRLTGISADIDQPVRSRPYWALVCTNGTELGRVDLASSSVGGGRFDGRFVVPAGCPLQMLAFGVRPSDAVSGIAGQIRHVALVPAS